jgi:hypothetical protein
VYGPGGEDPSLEPDVGSLQARSLQGKKW